jgi:hypothetical protein
LHRTPDLAIGDTQINEDNETYNGDERANTGLIAHQHLQTLSLSSVAELSNGADRRSGRSDSRPLLDFIFFALELFNFNLKLYRTASVTFLDRLFLFYVSVDEQVLYFCYPGSFFQYEILVSLHCQPPSKLF